MDTMLPKYQLPSKRKAASTINVDFSPDQVGPWLAKLAAIAPQEAAEKLLRFLNAFNRIELPGTHRQRLAGLLKTSVRHVAERLIRDLDTSSLPLPQDEYASLKLSQDLLGELALTQKQLIHDALTANQHKPSGTILADLLDTLNEIQISSYRSHTALPTGLWIDLHQSHLCAEQTAANSLANAYKSMLLLALADPYQFTRQELDWALALAAETAGIASLHPANTDSRKSLAPFLIQAEVDVPPQPLARHYTKAQCDLLFETSGIARHLALLGNAIKHHRASPGLKLPPESDWGAYQTLLNKLKLRWGASKHRMVQRIKSPTEANYLLTLGLANLQRLGSEQAKQANSPIPLASCSSLNDSTGGLALKHIGQLPFNMAVGEVVALQRPGHGKWQVGIIRWFKQNHQSELMFGLQLLASQLESTETSLLDGTTSSTGFLLRNHSNAQVEYLLLPQGIGRTGTPLSLNQANGESRQISLGPQTENGCGVAIFRIQNALPANQDG